METRLIVSRPDERRRRRHRTNKALFGTYVWNEDETEAVLVRDPLRNGKPFRDRLLTYVTDEQQADEVIATGPRRPCSRRCATPGVTRTYAIPGSERCIQCHMGAPDEDFVLGFTPLADQPPARRARAASSKTAARDELNQLQRLIDYGVITGMDSSGRRRAARGLAGRAQAAQRARARRAGLHARQLRPLPQPARLPVGERARAERPCSTSSRASVGGVFQFPLEQFSPRIFRGATAERAASRTSRRRCYDRIAGNGLAGRRSGRTERRQQLPAQGIDDGEHRTAASPPLAQPDLSERRHAVHLRRRLLDLSPHAA